jgi:methionyl-tRNA formyltransferase
MDHGPILAQRELEFPISNFQFPKLNEELAKLSAELLIETLPKWVAGEIKPIPQDHSKATFTRRIKKEDGLIDWSKNASEIEKMTRAYWLWPGAYTNFNNKVLKIIKAHLNFEETWAGKAGTIFLTKNNELAVTCGQDALILEELQLEGKRKMTAQEFLNGHPDFISSSL